MVYRTLAHLLIRNEGVQNTMGVQFTIQGRGVHFSIKGVQYTMYEKVSMLTITAPITVIVLPYTIGLTHI